MKKIAAAFIAGVVFASASSVFAGEAIKKVQAVLAQDVTVKVDGEKVNLQNTPITYGGTTYLPVRDAANAVGAELKWDSKTKTVELTTSGQQKEAPAKVQEPQTTTPQPEPAKPAVTGQNQEGEKEAVDTSVTFWSLGTKLREKGYDLLGDANKRISLVRLDDPKDSSKRTILFDNIPYTVVSGETVIDVNFYKANIESLLQ